MDTTESLRLNSVRIVKYTQSVPKPNIYNITDCSSNNLLFMNNKEMSKWLTKKNKI